MYNFLLCEINFLLCEIICAYRECYVCVREEQEVLNKDLKILSEYMYVLEELSHIWEDINLAVMGIWPFGEVKHTVKLLFFNLKMDCWGEVYEKRLLVLLAVYQYKLLWSQTFTNPKPFVCPMRFKLTVLRGWSIPLGICCTSSSLQIMLRILSKATNGMQFRLFWHL